MHFGFHGSHAASHYAGPTMSRVSHEHSAHSRSDGKPGRAEDCSRAAPKIEQHNASARNQGHHCHDGPYRSNGHHGAAEGYGVGVDRQQEIEKLADHLASPASGQSVSEALADAVITRLDGDQSGALNSEEIAGTHLADTIADGFYELDADQSGTLDRAELSGFLAHNGLAETEVADAQVVEVTPPEAVADDDEAELEELAVAAEDVAGEDPAASTGATTLSAAVAPAPAPSYEQRMADAFETALETLNQGQAPSWTVDIVKSLYGDVKVMMAG